MPFSLNFFANLPIDVLLLIYSKLPAQELYLKCRVLDKQQSFIATIALLEKQEQAAVSYQQRLIMSLLYSQKYSLMTAISFSKAYYNRLLSALWWLIKNPLLGLTNKLAVLKLICKLKGQDFTLANTIFDEIETKLKSKELGETNQAELLTVLMSGYIDNNVNVHGVVGLCLIKLVTKLTYAEQNKFIREDGNSLVSAYPKLFYQLINVLISQPERKERDLLQLLQSIPENDQFLQAFVTNYKILLNEQLPSNSPQPNL
ncbi:Uncharacterised protein [Legionella beliardensis]|uniref:F-box domain-containing protein n=1 Tax=Legionella beliardensis TaxID=91822 RepID=A0A378JRD6_9GAMM|nr:hypothetical protein [Legionella beliardensis]STX55761.1 Uncharacterised protein [Legionella beliardensis]